MIGEREVSHRRLCASWTRSWSAPTSAHEGDLAPTGGAVAGHALDAGAGCIGGAEPDGLAVHERDDRVGFRVVVLDRVEGAVVEETGAVLVELDQDGAAVRGRYLAGAIGHNQDRAADIRIIQGLP